MDIEDVVQDLNRISDRLDEIERNQWVANGRIRQDTSSNGIYLGILTTTVLLMWAGVEFRWWFVLVYFVLGALSVGHISGKAFDQEQIRSR